MFQNSGQIACKMDPSVKRTVFVGVKLISHKRKSFAFKKRICDLFWGAVFQKILFYFLLLTFLQVTCKGSPGAFVCFLKLQRDIYLHIFFRFVTEVQGDSE